MPPRVTIKPGHVRPLYTGHPWVFQQAVLRIEGGAQPGDEVIVTDPQGQLLGRGLYSPQSAIVVRLFTRSDRAVDAALFRERFERARARRAMLGLPDATEANRTDAYRLVHGEGDDLPGLVVDVFGKDVVVQLNTIGMKRREGLVFELIEEMLKPRAILDRTPDGVRRMEGFDPTPGIARGDARIEAMRFSELGVTYEIPIELGQKTGFYLDQRGLRRRIRSLARGRRVLDVYAYVGAFGIHAALGGATEVLCVDESVGAVTTGASIARLNGVEDRVSFVKEDALRALGDASRRGGYDLVLCDPPKFAPSKANRDGALAAYRRVAKAGLLATRPGGHFVMSSCSAAVSFDDLIRLVAVAAREVRMSATVLERWSHQGDHPVAAAFGEGLYLKSIVTVAEPLV